MSILRNLATGALLAVAGFLRRASNAFTAVAAGVCDEEDLLDRIQRYWYHAEDFYRERFVLSGLMDWEEKAYGAYLPGRRRIGLIGCGSGRDLIALARQGYEVEGVDFSLRAVDMARDYLAKARIKATVHCADISTFLFPGERYDAFIFSWYTYIYVPNASRRIQMLRNLRPKLAPNGCVIISFTPSGGERFGRFIQLARWVARITRNPHPPELGDHFVYHFARDLFYAHLFTREEIAAEAEAAHFEVVHSEGSHGSEVAVLKPKGS